MEAQKVTFMGLQEGVSHVKLSKWIRDGKVQNEATSVARYDMPEDSSGRYMFGMDGAFVYYSIPAGGKDIDLQSGYLVTVNDN